MSVVFEILGLKARLQGLCTSAILVKHWETEVFAVILFKALSDCWLLWPDVMGNFHSETDAIDGDRPAFR